MRRAERQMTDPAELDKVLAQARFCRIAMCDGDRPYLVAVCFGYEPGRLYFHSATEGRKLAVLRANPRVCFQTDVDAEVLIEGVACKCTVRFRSVIGSGVATILTDPDEKRHGLDVLMQQYADEPRSYPDETLARTAVVRIDIEAMTGKQSPAPTG